MKLCYHCERELPEGSTAYVIEVQRVEIQGTVVRQWVEEVLVCEEC